MAPPLHSLSSAPQLRELASGVDALYISGKSLLPPALTGRLEASRAVAAELDDTVEVELGGQTWRLQGGSRQKYRFVLLSEFGWFGLTESASLPTVWVQPKAILLHAVGPADALRCFTDPIEAELGQIPWKASRVDLQSDWQGMSLHRDLSDVFVGRAKARSIYEDGELCTGFTFGAGKGGGIYGRIYDKTAEIAAKGGDYWFDVWAERYDRSTPVHRVEFQWGRQALRTMQVSSPDEVLSAVGDLWRESTHNWLTLRTPTADQTRARWPLAPWWEAVQQSALAHDPIGVARLKEADRQGALRLLLPQLNGYASSAAVHLGTVGIDDTLAALAEPLRGYEETSGMPFELRVESKRRRWGSA